MIRSFVAAAAVVLSVSQAHAVLWRCEVISKDFTNKKVVYTGMGTTQGLAEIRATNKCQEKSLGGILPCSKARCTRK